MVEQPIEVRALRHLYTHLVQASRTAVELAQESTRHAGAEPLESRYLAMLGQEMSWNFICEMQSRLGDQARWHEDRGFVAMVPHDLGLAIRLGRCDGIGRPKDTRERDEGTPFRKFQLGESLLFEDAELTPIFAGFSLTRSASPEFDRVILAKYQDGVHVWSWGLEPELGEAPLRAITPVEIPIERQRRIS